MIKINGDHAGGGGIPVKMPAQGGDSVSRNLQNQIASAQKELQEISKNQEMPPEEKMKRRQELNQQIAELSSQLKQHEAELRRERQMETAVSKQEPAEGMRSQDGDTAEFSPEGMESVLSADFQYCRKPDERLGEINQTLKEGTHTRQKPAEEAEGKEKENRKENADNTQQFPG